MTNSDRLQEIRERAEKATPGPWIAQEGGNGDAGVTTLFVSTVDVAPETWQCVAECLFDRPEDNATFIAAAREDIPWLLQLVTEQQREIETLKGLVESYSEELDGIKAAYQI